MNGCSAGRRMRGGSQAHLIRAEDGWYVVKLLQNPQHKRILANEALASELLSLLGIATPEWAAVRIDDEFLSREESIGFETVKGFEKAKPGWHFGSKCKRHPDTTAISDFVSPPMMERVSNVDDFFKVLVFDIWVDNRDARQAIFVESRGGRILAQMIDNGFAFGFDGVDDCLRDHCRPSAPYLLSSAYLGAAAQFRETIERVRQITAADILAIIGELPMEWLTDIRKFEVLARDLQLRGERLPTLLAQTLAKLS